VPSLLTVTLLPLTETLSELAVAPDDEKATITAELSS
jgi:hypothetical protein